jgi:hypothetical protein
VGHPTSKLLHLRTDFSIRQLLSSGNVSSSLASSSNTDCHVQPEIFVPALHRRGCRSLGQIRIQHGGSPHTHLQLVALGGGTACFDGSLTGLHHIFHGQAIIYILDYGFHLLIRMEVQRSPGRREGVMYSFELSIVMVLLDDYVRRKFKFCNTSAHSRDLRV